MFKPEIILTVIVMLIVSYTDLKYRMIKNWVVLPAALIGLLLGYMNNGWDGLLFSLQGWVTGAGIFIVAWALGFSGAGDAKLMGAFGSLIGPYNIFIALKIWAVIYLAIVLVNKISSYGLRLDKAIVEEAIDLKHKTVIPRKSVRMAPVFSLAVLISLFWR